MLTKPDAEIGRRVVWRSPIAAGEVRYGTIADVIDDIEVVIAYDDGAMGLSYIGNEMSNVQPA
jgi:hypothetical protein